MGNIETVKETPKNKEVIKPDTIDTWLYSQYKLDAIYYFLSIDLENTDKEDIAIPNEIGLNPGTIQSIVSFIDKNIDADMPLKKTFIDGLKNIQNSRSVSDLLGILMDYPSLLRLLKQGDYLREYGKGFGESRVLSPYKICETVGNKFYSKNKKEILFDSDTGKSLLVVYGTGKGGKYMSLYDPMHIMLSSREKKLEYDADPVEEYWREWEWKEWQKWQNEQENNGDPIDDIIY